MTDRVLTLVVTLEDTFRIDDVQSIVKAIKMIKHVADVKENIYTGTDQMNAMAAMNNFKYKLIENLVSLIHED